jgi:hypothetical protein
LFGVFLFGYAVFFFLKRKRKSAEKKKKSVSQVSLDAPRSNQSLSQTPASSHERMRFSLTQPKKIRRKESG